MSDRLKYEIYPNRQRLSGNALKIIALITMIIDHTASALLSPYMDNLPHTQNELSVLHDIYVVMRAVGRTAFPIFCFLLAEGFHYTHDRFRYLRNILVFAFISEYPFDLALYGGIHFGHQNVMFTLAIGLAVIWGMEASGKSIQKRSVRQENDDPGGDNAGKTAKDLEKHDIEKQDKEKQDKEIGVKTGEAKRAALRRAAGVREIDLDPDMIVSHEEKGHVDIHKKMLEEHSGYGPVWAGFLQIMAGMGLMIAGMLTANYLHTDYSMIGVVLICVMYLLRGERLYAGIAGYAVMCWEPWSFPAFILIQFYNGKRGRGWKYFFYAFYPAHLLVLYLIRHFCLGMH